MIGKRYPGKIATDVRKEDIDHSLIASTDGEAGDANTIALFWNTIPYHTVLAKLAFSWAGPFLVCDVYEAAEKVKSQASLLDRQKPSQADPWAVEVAVSLSRFVFSFSEREVAGKLGLCENAFKTCRTNIKVGETPKCVPLFIT